MNTRLFKKSWAILLLGMLLGVLAIQTFRLVTYKAEDQVHYHANFAVYVNGAREAFKGMQYYEETEATECTLVHVDSPNERAHMHGNVSDVIHVEDHLVTWGHFFQNLNWGLGDDYLKTPDSVLTSNDEGQLSFVLNGEKIDSVAGKIIGNRDKLLVSFGSENNDQLQQQYASIADTAEKYNTEQDPAGCSGNRPMKMMDKMKAIF